MAGVGWWRGSRQLPPPTMTGLAAKARWGLRVYCLGRNVRVPIFFRINPKRATYVQKNQSLLEIITI